MPLVEAFISGLQALVGDGSGGRVEQAHAQPHLPGGVMNCCCDIWFDCCIVWLHVKRDDDTPQIVAASGRAFPLSTGTLLQCTLL